MEKEVDALELKVESAAPVESQTDGHTHEEQTEKSLTPAPPTAEPTSDPTPAAPEENRVGWTSARLSAGHLTSKATSKLLPPLQPFSWASVTSKNLPPSGAVPVSGIPPHVVKVVPAAPVGPASSPQIRQLIGPCDTHEPCLILCSRPGWR